MNQADSALRRYQVVCLVLMSAAILTASLWGGMLYDRVNPNPESSGVLYLVGFPLAAVLSMAALAVALWFDNSRWKFGVMGLGGGGLVVWSAVSVFDSPTPHASLVTVAILGTAAALGWALVSARLPKAVLLGVAMAMVTSASLVAALGVSEYIGHVARPPRDFSWRVFSTFATPNFLAGYLGMTIPLTVACLLASRERLEKLLGGLGLSLQSGCLLLTGSRFGIVCLAAGLVTFAVLVTRRGLVQRVAGPRGRVVGAIILAVALLGAIPVALRLFRTGAESHSTLFRYYTWRGTAKMAVANPLFGTGLGSFDASHGPYSEVAYTQHAHNSYLQLAAESGFPALVFLLLLSGVALTGSVSAARPESESADSSECAFGLISAGLAGGLVGGLLRNLFDSDLYVPANACTFAMLCALAVSLKPLQPKSGVAQPWIRRGLAGAAILAALSFLVPYTVGRFFARAGEEAVNRRDLYGASAEYKRAADFDHGNQEYLLKLASLQAAAGDFAAAEQSYQGAIGWAKTGKAYYQYARFLGQQRKMEVAYDAHEKARAIEPNNLQNLLALAEAYSSASRTADAERVYRHIAALYERPFGRIRAVPELIEYEFGEAYRALGEIEMSRNDVASAERNLRRAVEILGEFWARRKNPMVQLQVRPEKSLLVGKRYEEALALLSKLLRNSERIDEGTKLDVRKTELAAEIEQDRAAASRPGE